MVLSRVLPRSHELLRLFVAIIIGVLVGAWLIPSLVVDNNVSLLNTFAALVLPGMANGFSIFLLKGFFDSLPTELYEAAELDGAGEWHKFWMITMGLSKPILAVIGLGAFTGAYAQFMMALIIIPDQHMWTIMVWLYQFQLLAHPSVQYAALALAAIPTLLVFIFCQNLIIRGIVVPVEK
jgi:multiple sugar transport system permease protein